MLGGIPVVPPKLSEERNALSLELNSVEVDLAMVVTEGNGIFWGYQLLRMWYVVTWFCSSDHKRVYTVFED